MWLYAYHVMHYRNHNLILRFSTSLYALWRCLMFYCFSSSPSFDSRYSWSLYSLCLCTVYLNLAKLHPVIMRILIVRSWRSYPEARASAHTFHFMVILLPRLYTLLLVRAAATGAADLLYAMHSMATSILALTWTQIRSVRCDAYSGSEFIIHNLWYGRLLLLGRQIGMTIGWIVCIVQWSFPAITT